ncbi:MAG: HAD family hydrolase, partial [Methylophilaceae bacterium]
MPKRFDLIVFDWDGTLVDSTQLIVDSVRAASLDVGLPVPEPS